MSSGIYDISWALLGTSGDFRTHVVESSPIVHLQTKQNEKFRILLRFLFRPS